LWELFKDDPDERSEDQSRRKIKIWHILHALDDKDFIKAVPKVRFSSFTMLIFLLFKFLNLFETSTNILLLKTVIFLMRPTARISHESIRKGITAYRM
jgi:hypothetical protein